MMHGQKNIKLSKTRFIYPSPLNNGKIQNVGQVSNMYV